MHFADETTHSHSRQGFSLVETAVAIIVISTILIGSLLAADLILAAQVRKQAGALEQFNAATIAFVEKYGCLPSDCNNAFQQGITENAAENGNGNGKFDSINVGRMELQELRNFWLHLHKAGLIEQSHAPGTTPGINSPPLDLPPDVSSEQNPGGVWIVSSETNLFMSGTKWTVTAPAWLLINDRTSYMPQGVYLPKKAALLDEKIDDGLPLAGKMQVFSYLFHFFPASNVSGGYTFFTTALGEGYEDSCIDDSDPTIPPRYNVEKAMEVSPNALCAPIIQTQFTKK